MFYQVSMKCGLCGSLFPYSYVYDDIVTRAVTIRNAPDDARDLDTATAIDRAHDHLGAEARAWALDGAERVNYDTVIVHFTQL